MGWLFGIVGAVLLYLFLIAPACKKNQTVEALGTTLFAHRGLHDLKNGVPENSMAAFRRAKERGLGIEFDVHVAADGSMIVMHDDSVKRTTGGEGRISKMTRAELDQFALIGNGERIPDLMDVLELINGEVPLCVELKADGANAKALCEGAFKVLDQYKGPYVVESFDPRVIAWVRKHRPQVGRGQLATDAGLDPVTKVLLQNLMLNVLSRPHFISYEYNKMHKVPGPWLCRHLFGAAMYAWTVPDQNIQRKMTEKEISSIFEGYIPE